MSISLSHSYLNTSVVASVEALPERVLQFGTGAFLRGFADVMVDDANRAGQFDGRVVMVGSTGSGRTHALENQDGLYTLCVRGLRDGQPVETTRVIASVSRALAASEEWAQVLELARNPDLQLVISNTTEVGITDDPDDHRDLDPPRSFPGKLTAVLLERAGAFQYAGGDLIVLPCELIEGNGDCLRQLVEGHARRWNADTRFAEWLAQSVTFCNTLVDRIVPGTPEDASDLYERLGYTDDLLTVAEPYRLWAIEGTDELAARLPLARLDGVVVTEDLAPYRIRKVRILNGGHTSTVPTALLCGLATVRKAMNDADVGTFVRRLVRDEIVPSLEIDPEMARSYAEDVLDRFTNPFVDHALLDITFQQTAKLGVRVLPSVSGYIARYGMAPPLLAFGVAAFFASTRPGALPEDRPTDDATANWAQRWTETVDPHQLVREALVEVWSFEDRAGFSDRVADALVAIHRDGARVALSNYLSVLAR